MDIAVPELRDLERRLLDIYQRDFPLVPEPYAEIARRLGITEKAVLGMLSRLLKSGISDLVGAVIAPRQAGWSTLAAMKVPRERLEEVAEVVNAYPEVNHNYEREHPCNPWFVITGPDVETVTEVLLEIGERCGFLVLDLPLIDAFHLDLGFPVQ